MMITTTTLFIFLMFFGTAFLGLSEVLKRKALKDGIGTQVLISILAILAGVFAWASVFIQGLPEIKPEFWVAFGATVSLNLIGQNAFVLALKHSEVSLVSPVKLLTVVFITITGFMVLGEKISVLGFVGIGVTILGLMVLLSHSGNFSPVLACKRIFSNKGPLFALISALIFSFSPL